MTVSPGTRRRRLLAAGTFIVLAALLVLVGFRVSRYFSARAHFQAAEQALEQHDWSAARMHLDASLRAWPDSVDAHLRAARVARRLEYFRDAEEHLAACQRVEGAETQAIKVERALLRVHRGDLAGMEEFLRARVKQDDADAVEILDVLSAALILQYRVAEAYTCLDDLLRRQPNHFHALVRRGWAAEKLSFYLAAVESFQKALDLRPDANTVRLSLAEIEVILGRFAEAQEHFEYLRRQQPNDPAVLFGLARCLAGGDQKEPALQILDSLLADHPADWKALAERGWLSVQLNRPAEAETYLRRALSLAPPDLPLLTRLADCLRLLGKPDEARIYQAKADRLKADIQRAASLGDQIREKSPNDPALRHELGAILLRLGKQQDAVHWFQTALEKDPAYRPAHESLAAFYKSVGAEAQAAHHQRVLLDLGAVKK